ncbi:GNAT family N-acetyltransferase [uncultured Rothia sp.]|uniref:GNAT family N-acetyltransferase n=1 Tax=uncultured Rothia sp. TaxID=316088 RepID=UPI003216C713
MLEVDGGFHVREAEESDMEGVIETLSDAFRADPVMGMALGGMHRINKIRRLFNFQIESTYKDAGKIDVAVDADGTIIGAALWIGPDAQRQSFQRDLKNIPAYLKILGTSFPSGIYTELMLLRARPRFEHWYLYTIGVHSNARGRGVGGQLLDFRRHQLGQHPAYLEASTIRSAALYRRHGFVELGEFPGGKPALGMWHPPVESPIDKMLK